MRQQQTFESAQTIQKFGVMSSKTLQEMTYTAPRYSAGTRPKLGHCAALRISVLFDTDRQGHAPHLKPARCVDGLLALAMHWVSTTASRIWVISRKVGDVKVARTADGYKVVENLPSPARCFPSRSPIFIFFFFFSIIIIKKED